MWPKPKVPVVNDRAVAVALDALQQASAFPVYQGAYIGMDSDLDQALLILNDLVPGLGVQRLLPTLQRADCQVCALGACMLAKARLYDSLPLSSLIHKGELIPTPKQVQEALSDVFDAKQCCLIESAFEEEERGLPSRSTAAFRKEVERAIEFGSRYDCNDDRFEAIMTNIIENGGVFVPPVEVDDGQ